MLKWQEDYLVQIGQMTNEEVLDEYTSLSGGDDYDGCMTQRGEWEYEKIRTELYKRLKECEFL